MAASARVGPQGPAGPQGEQGPVGPAGAGASYEHDQAVASAEWVIDHGLQRSGVSVVVIDTAGTQCWAEAYEETISRLRLRFSTPFSGKAYVST